ncbi:hypothetical protein AVJ23_02720 [Pseudoponticoccus marisrubri]|uniref:Succinate dehydrogenase n=1 Tax=Pseudoponticoccus marisrubri TaxID=1685382 RepID=A0A0W7WQH4_9RHOB|nr:hypothetical protein AVJ23_02720 [Pseudoponticoccus marisrubri]
MIRPALGTALLALGLAACSPQAQDRITRDAARATLTRVVTDRYPALPVEPAIDCLIDNASAVQIRALAADAVLGPTEGTIEIVSQIVSKPETLTCLAAEGLPALLR